MHILCAEDNAEDGTSTVTKRGRGRPQIIRTGAKGRPRKPTLF